MTIVYEAREQQARHYITLLGGGEVATTLEALIELINTDREEILVIFGPSTPLSEAVGFADQCRTHRPRVGVLLLRQHVDTPVRDEALRAGVRDVVDAADHAALLDACARSREESRRLAVRPPSRTTTSDDADEDPARPQIGSASIRTQAASTYGTTPGDRARARTRVAEPDDTPRDGKVVTIFSAKGGCGKSLVATNLAVALADGGKAKVCLLDLDLAFGDVAIMLQLDPQRTIADAVPVADRIDETGLRTLITPYAPGLDVLLAPVQPAVADEVGRDLVAEVLGLARGMYDYVVVDTATQFTEQVITALDASHEYVLVTVPELPALKNLRVTLDMFDLLDYRRENRTVVLNRADTKVGLSTTDVERVTKVPIAAFIPSSRDVPVSVNRGVPIIVSQPGHPVSAAIRELSRVVAGVPVPTRRRGLILRKGKS